MPRPDNYDGTPGFCEHCWTVSDLLTNWQPEDTWHCSCVCHNKPQSEPKKVRKKK